MLRSLALLALFLTGSVATAAGIRFEVTIDPKLAGDTFGRVIVGFAPKGQPPAYTSSDPFTLPILGVDVPKFTPETTVIVDASALTFPLNSMAALKKGEYSVQALFATNRDISIPTAPGNCISELTTISLDPAVDSTTKLKLTKTFEEPAPKDTDTQKFLQFPSKLLSEFHKRPMVYRVAVVLPASFEKEPEKKYAMIVRIGPPRRGFGGNAEDVRRASDIRRRWSLGRNVSLSIGGRPPGGWPSGDRRGLPHF